MSKARQQPGRRNWWHVHQTQSGTRLCQGAAIPAGDARRRQIDPAPAGRQGRQTAMVGGADRNRQPQNRRGGIHLVLRRMRQGPGGGVDGVKPRITEIGPWNLRSMPPAAVCFLPLAETEHDLILGHGLGYPSRRWRGRKVRWKRGMGAMTECIPPTPAGIGKVACGHSSSPCLSCHGPLHHLPPQLRHLLHQTGDSRQPGPQLSAGLRVGPMLPAI